MSTVLRTGENITSDPWLVVAYNHFAAAAAVTAFTRATRSTLSADRASSTGGIARRRNSDAAAAACVAVTVISKVKFADKLLVGSLPAGQPPWWQRQ